MKRAAVLAFALVVVAAIGLGAQGTNFSGTWALDQAKSQMPQMGGGGGGRGPGGGGPMTITQTAAELAIERAGMGGQTTKSVYKLDGSESVNTTGRGESKSKCKWEGAKLVIATTSVFGERTINMTAAYSLSADGKVLTVEQTRPSQDGTDVKSTMVYNKQ